jgi:hypothetical protein
MSDLIRRLRLHPHSGAWDDALSSCVRGIEAADALEAKDAEIARLREALAWAYQGDGLDEVAMTFQHVTGLFGKNKGPNHTVQIGLRVVIDKIRERAALAEGENNE